MAGDNILAAIEKLEDKRVKYRDQGLEDLRRILKGARPVSNIHKLRDFGWHTILDTLFARVKSEKHDLLAGSATAKRSAASRLPATAEALRLVVDSSVTYLRHKTAYAVLDHVDDTLDFDASTDHTFRQLIVADYLKIFSTILADESHGEHLRAKDWQRYIDFVLAAINSQSADEVDATDVHHPNGNAHASRDFSFSASARSALPARQSQASGAGGSRLQSSFVLDHLMTSLMSLTSISNSPLSSRLSVIAQTILSALSAPLQLRDVAFKCLNNVLTVALTEDTLLSAHIVAQVVVVIRNSWPRKDDKKPNRLREQMLTSLLLGRHLLQQNVLTRTTIDPATVESLARTLSEEYEDRNEQSCLQIADLVFSRTDKDDIFQRGGVAPNLNSYSATLNWTNVGLISTLRSVSGHQFNSQEEQGDEQDDETLTRKRQKVSVPFADFVCWLMLDVECVDISQFLDSREALLLDVTDDQTTRPSWALLVLARMSRMSFAHNSDLHGYWIRVWKAASHLIISPSNSRAACFTMMVLLDGGHVDSLLSSSDLISFCFHGGTRGPINLTDAALLLLSSCLRSASLDTERQFNLFRDKVLSWLDTVWILPTMRDHSLNVEVAHMGKSVLLYDILRALGGLPRLHGSKDWIFSPPAIYQTYAQSKDNDRFAAFMMDTNKASSPESRMHEYSASGNYRDIARPKISPLAVSEFLQRKLEDFRHAFRRLQLTDCKQGSEEQFENKYRANLSVEIAEILSTACAVCALVLDPATTDQPRDAILHCWQCVYDFIWLHRKDIVAFESYFLRVAQRVLEIWPWDPTQQLATASRRLNLVTSLQQLITRRESAHISDSDMEVEFSTQPRNSQQSQSKSQNFEQDTSRRDLPFSTSTHGLFVEIRILLVQDSMGSDLANSSKLASAMIHHITTLPSDDLLASRTPLLEYLGDKCALTASDASRLLRHVAQVYLEVDQFERNEAALCYCLRIMTSLAYLWVHTDNDDLGDIAFDIYSWFIDTALGKGIASNRVLYHISELLDCLLKTHSRYGTDSNLPSPRTSLLEMLKKGPSVLKFQIVPSLTNLFEGYVLTEHAAVFDDVIDRLPTEGNDREGIAVRLYVLAKLGSRWRTVFRQAIYHIFETVANVPAATLVAKSALAVMAKEVGIEDGPRQLLHLFAPQIFYTWLEEGNIGTIPFFAFDYVALADLIKAEREELVAQAVLRQIPAHKKTMEDVLQLSWSDVLQEDFPRAQVYAIATDIVDNRAGADVGPIEKSLRSDLSVEIYTELAIQHFAEAVALAVLCLSDDKSLDKVLTSSSRYKILAETHEAIRKRGHSSTVHPPRQQPSFRAKYLIPILSKLCHIVGASLDSMWTPSLLVYVYRKILNDADPALGPLHVASVVRKVRIAATLAGPVALEGFPLQMILRALMPYLTNFHCSEDAIGVSWYLLEHGSGFLETDLSFLAGLSVSIFTSLSAFATSSQESTTQESQFIATMSKARDFRSWLGEYLVSLKTSQIDEDQAERLQEIVRHAKDVSAPGSNSKNEPEGLLLYHLLMDQATEDPLVPRNFFETIIRDLSDGFHIVQEASENILSNDEDGVICVPILWSVAVTLQVSQAFQTWIGKTLGQAYHARGPTLTVSSDKCVNPRANEDDKSLDHNGSIRRIVGALIDLLWQEGSLPVGMAENTLSLVLGSISASDRQTILSSHANWAILQDLVFESFPCPMPRATTTSVADFTECLDLGRFKDDHQWAASVAELTLREEADEPFLNGLTAILGASPSFGEVALPMIVHLVLEAHMNKPNSVRQPLSRLFNAIFENTSAKSTSISTVALKVILYLRRCIHPQEINFAARNKWLDIDYTAAAKAALHAHMPHAALLMLEISSSEHQLRASSRRSSVQASQGVFSPDDRLLANIFERVQDGDFFYGSHEESDITSILTKLRHEHEGSKALAFQSALFDSAMKTGGQDLAFKQQGEGMVTALALANLHGLACATRQYTGASMRRDQRAIYDNSLLNVHQWDIPGSGGDPTLEEPLQTVLQRVENFQSEDEIRFSLDAAVCNTVKHIVRQKASNGSLSLHLTDLAALTAVEQLLFAPRNGGLSDLWTKLSLTEDWVEHEGFPAVSKVLLAREAATAAIRHNDRANFLFKSSQSDLLLSEIRSVRSSLAIARTHNATQFCLNRAAYLHQLQDISHGVNLDVDSAITYDIAGTLWSQGEVTAPIQMLKSLEDSQASNKGALPISKAELLTDLGQKLSQARLYRPDEITRNYLQPAIDALDKDTSGAMAGRVYHNLAAFCDEQLSDSVAKDDFERISSIRNRKYQDVVELAELCKKSTGKERESFKMAYSKAKTWFKLDDEEYRRLKTNRETLLRSCLENYLLSIQSCDEYSRDVLRFLSLWLGNPKVQEGDSAIREYLRMVPSMKLAPFVNQLSSRLADSGEPFQKTLFEMFFRICRDHPFHSLYQLFSVFKSKGAREDEAAKSRQKAADRLARLIQSPEGKTSSQAWISVHNSNITFVNFAQEKNEKGAKTGKEIPMRNFVYGKKLEQTVQSLSRKIPPPTMEIPLRRDKDYSSLPTFATFEPNISVAGGVSAPKITTIVASDGTRHRMLLKGGNDDLRQDAIMEQVFKQVSDLLQDHRATRQRRLGIRTYKVIPLTHNSGIIEFVKNTIPLHEYLLPAHLDYYPKDFKPNACRQQIANAQTKPTKDRIKVFENVMAHFHPVMRFFFMERFPDPDDWFNKRLAYSRSTAAISILGHILGLGDRHGHNILLDEQTGEVVHIDLGVAFEAGRVLPVPEVVPFRLTRDLVDGMGLSGVEGPFRRCCNFTLEALRKNQDVIMTILDVLRWDPLYSWSVSPLRVQRMQDAQEREAAATAAAAAAAAGSEETLAEGVANTTLTSKKKDKDKHDDEKGVNEPGEADRALSIVAKKLSAGLSVEATVNELIRQATDVDNLAVLYCGWAAYA